MSFSTSQFETVKTWNYFYRNMRSMFAQNSVEHIGSHFLNINSDVNVKICVHVISSVCVLPLQQQATVHGWLFAEQTHVSLQTKQSHTRSFSNSGAAEGWFISFGLRPAWVPSIHIQSLTRQDGSVVGLLHIAISITEPHILIDVE